MAKLEQKPAALDHELIAGRPYVFTVTCTGATISSPTITVISGQSDIVTAGAPSVAVDGSNVITISWTDDDTTALAALKTPGRTAAFRYDLSALVDGEGPYSLLARNFSVLPLGSATTGTQSTSATLAFEIGQADVSLAVTLAGGADGSAVINGSGAPTSGDGEDGDFYIATSTWTIYGPKATTWPSGVSLIGAAGSNGTNGTNGSNGDWSTAQTLRAVSTTSDTPTSTDAGKLVTLSNASAITVTIDGSLNLSTGQRIDFAQTGAGQVTFSASGATVNGTPGLKTRAQYSACTLICTAADTYLLVGDLSA